MRLIGLVAWDAHVLLGEATEGEERLSQAQLNSIADLVPDIVLALRRYWLDHPVAAPPRKGAAHAGANVPCPCGSGKKFKECHGSSLH